MEKPEPVQTKMFEGDKVTLPSTFTQYAKSRPGAAYYACRALGIHHHIALWEVIKANTETDGCDFDINGDLVYCDIQLKSLKITIRGSRDAEIKFNDNVIFTWDISEFYNETTKKRIMESIKDFIFQNKYQLKVL